MSRSPSLLGGECLADVSLLRAEPALLGPVASDPTVARLIDTLAAGGKRAEAVEFDHGSREVLMPRQEAKLDLIVDVKPVSGRLHTYWEYDTTVLSEATVQRVLDEFGSWLIWGLTRSHEPVRARGTLREEQ